MLTKNNLCCKIANSIIKVVKLINETFLRFGIIIISLYYLYELWPFFANIENTPVLYSFDTNNTYENLVQGKEWAYVALQVFIFSFLILHALFWGLINNQENSYGKDYRNIIFKFLDYIWYIFGLVSILIVLINLNSRQIQIHIDYKKQELKKVEKNLSNVLDTYIKDCSILMDLVQKHTSEENEAEDESEDKKFLYLICESKKSDVMNIIVEYYSHEQVEYNLDPGNEPKYRDDTKIRNTELTKAFNSNNYMYSIISTIKDLKQAIKYLKTKSNKSYPLWYILFPIVISLRLVKTSAELIDELKKCKMCL